MDQLLGELQVCWIEEGGGRRDEEGGGGGRDGKGEGEKGGGRER